MGSVVVFDADAEDVRLESFDRDRLLELDQLRALAELRRRFGVALDEVAFALRLRREPELRAAVETWLAATDSAAPAWVEWEQRKQERLLAA